MNRRQLIKCIAGAVPVAALGFSPVEKQYTIWTNFHGRTAHVLLEEDYFYDGWFVLPGDEKPWTGAKSDAERLVKQFRSKYRGENYWIEESK